MKYLAFFLSLFLYFAILLWGAVAWLLAGASTDEEWQQYQAKIQNVEQLLQKNAPANWRSLGHLVSDTDSEADSQEGSTADSQAEHREQKLPAPVFLRAESPESEEGLFSQVLDRKLYEIHSPGVLLYAFKTGEGKGEGADSGQILWQKDMDTARPTASMTKVMSLLLIQEFLRDYEIDPEQVQRIPRLGAAAERPFDASVAGLRAELELSWKQLLTYVIVASANDAVYALAILSEQARSPEGLSEQEAIEVFVARMLRRAAELKLDSAYFVDPDGWSEADVISPLDMVRLAAFYTENFPEILQLHQQQTVELVPALGEKKGQIKRNTNILLPIYPQIDGLKTGFTYEAGFNFCATALRGDWRYLVVVMGLQEQSIAEGLRRRAAEAEVLLNWGMSHFRPLSSSSTPQGVPQDFSNESQGFHWKNSLSALQAEFETTLHSSLLWYSEPSTGLLIRSSARRTELAQAPQKLQAAEALEALEVSGELTQNVAEKPAKARTQAEAQIQAEAQTQAQLEQPAQMLRYQIDEEQLYKGPKGESSQSPYLGVISVEYAPEELAYLLLPAQYEPHFVKKSFIDKLLQLRGLLIESFWPLIKGFFVDVHPYGILELEQKSL